MPPDDGSHHGNVQLLQLEQERRHALIKAGIAVLLAAALAFLMIWPGWIATQSKPSIPTPPNSVLGLGFGDGLPDSDRNRVSLSLNTRQAGPTLALSLEVEQEDEFETPPVLVMSMDVGEHLRGCTGVGYSTERDIAFERLHPVAQAIVTHHWEAVISRQNLDDTEVSDIDVASRAQASRYLEIQFETEPYKYSIQYNDDQPVRSVAARRTERECQFAMEGFWTSNGPYHGLSIPRMTVAYPKGEEYDQPAVQRSIEAKITDLGELSMTQSSSVPDSSDDGSPRWGESSPGFGATIGKYRVQDARPVGVAFRSITRTQSDQETVFWAGVGIGLAGSLLVMALPLFYDAQFVLGPRIRTARRLAGEGVSPAAKAGDSAAGDPGD